MENKNLYNTYSDFLKKKYGEKVYKLPINLPISCPNRDGNIDTCGCTFCGEKGAGHESLDSSLHVKEQIRKNKDYIAKRYKAKKFIAYLQNFSNTYMPLEQFKEVIDQCIDDGIVELAVSTRPDCIRDEYLTYLKEVSEKNDINISIELGLQTVNYHTLNKIHRGHTLAQFIDSVLRIHKYGFPICAHVILNLPWDDMEDCIECAKILTSLNVQQVKLHSLYIIKNTIMAKQYMEGEFQLIDCEEYKRRVIAFLEHLGPDMIIQRIMARAPEEETLFANWNRSWWVIKEEIEEQMEQKQTYQGKNCNYLNGPAVKSFFDK